MKDTYWTASWTVKLRGETLLKHQATNLVLLLLTRKGWGNSYLRTKKINTRLGVGLI